MDTIKTELSTDLFADFIIENDPGNTNNKLDTDPKDQAALPPKANSKETPLLEISKSVEFGDELEKALADNDAAEPADKEDDKPDDIDLNDKKDSNKKDDEDDEDQSSYSFKALASYLSEQGVIEFEDSDDIDDSPDILANSIQNTVNALITDYKESLPDVVADLVSYIEKGGDASKYLEAIQKPLDLSTIDMEDEYNQKLIIKEYLKAQEFTEEEITEKIQDYEDAMLLEKESRTASKKLDKIFEKKQQEIVKEQELENKARQKQSEEYISTLQNTIKSSSDFAGIPIDDKTKKAFEAYLLTKDKTGVTGYQKDLNEDPIKTQLELAYLKFIKYNFKDATAKAKSEVTKDLKKIFKNNEGSIKGKSREVDITNSRGADLSAFKNIFNK